MSNEVRKPIARRLPPRNGVLAAAIAGACLALAVIVRIPLDAAARTPLPPFITFYPLLSLIGFLAGARIGLASVAASLLIAWFFWIAPPSRLEIRDAHTALTLVAYAVAGGLTVVSGAWTRGLFERLKVREAEKDRMARETAHRVKNLIAVMQAMSNLAAKRAGSMDEYRRTLSASFGALGRAQDVLIEAGLTGSPLYAIVEAATAAFRPHEAFEMIGGPDLTVGASVAIGLSLALNELCTNSLKYGALGGKGGSVAISWTGDATDRALVWREQAAASTASEGFGSKLIRSAFAGQRDASVDYRLDAREVICTFRWRDA